jgi:uncharacterized membrane protein YciS (DUF1049 family)
MKERDADRHPGPWRVMGVDSEFAGLLVAVGFLVMGFVSMPLAAGFVVGAIAMGVIVALVLRSSSKKFRQVAGVIVVGLTAVMLWWLGRNPQRPRTVLYSPLYVLLAAGFVLGAIILGVIVALTIRSVRRRSDERQG